MFPPEEDYPVPPALAPDYSPPSPVVQAAAGLPTPPGEAAPDYSAILDKLGPQPLSGAQRALRIAIPAIAAAVALANKNRGAALGGFAGTYTKGMQINQQNEEREALQKQRVARAIKDLQAEGIAQKKIDAQARQQAAAAQAAQLAKHMTALRQHYDRVSSGDNNIVETVNQLQDEQGPQAVDQYLNSTVQLEDGTKAPLRDVFQFAQKAPDGLHYIGGKTKSITEAKYGTVEKWVQDAVDEASKAGPLTFETRRAIEKKAIDEYKNLGPAGDMTAVNMALKNLALHTAQLKEQELLNNMKPDARAAKILGPTGRVQLEDTDVTLHNLERLRDMLKIHGLQNDNNPISSREAALKASYGISPGDLAGDIVQQAAFARMKGYSAQGRGNAGRSMAMLQEYGQHLNDSKQTYGQMYRVANDLIREFKDMRNTHLHTAGVSESDVPYQSTMSNGKFYVGQSVKLKDGTQVRVGKVYADGSWDPE
jgi:hypothetical protein